MNAGNFKTYSELDLVDTMIESLLEDSQKEYSVLLAANAEIDDLPEIFRDELFHKHKEQGKTIWLYEHQVHRFESEHPNDEALSLSLLHKKLEKLKQLNDAILDITAPMH